MPHRTPPTTPRPGGHATDDDRLAPQLGAVALLDGGKEGVQIDMEDRVIRIAIIVESSGAPARTTEVEDLDLRPDAVAH